MKKLLSVLLSIMMIVAVGTSFAVPAFAATNVNSPSGEVIPGDKENNKDDNKSPETGAATLGLATTAALGAGAALTLLKKKDAE